MLKYRMQNSTPDLKMRNLNLKFKDSRQFENINSAFFGSAFNTFLMVYVITIFFKMVNRI